MLNSTGMRKPRSRWEKARKIGTSPGDLDRYVGKYYNSAETFMVEIRRAHDTLCLAFEGRDNEIFRMQHYHDHTFTWLQPPNDLVGRARTVGQGAAYYLVAFNESHDSISPLTWAHDTQMPEGEQYTKR